MTAFRILKKGSVAHTNRFPERFGRHFGLSVHVFVRCYHLGQDRGRWYTAAKGWQGRSLNQSLFMFMAFSF